MDILIRMLMAVLKDRKHKKQRRVLSTVLAAVVVFMTTYSLILPAITLEESTAETTDGIFLESADVSEADPADDDVDPSGELLLTDDAREESAQASDGWEDGLIEDADWEENGELADIPDEPALTDTGDEATPDGILEEATDAAEAEEDTQALSFTDGELTVRETLVSRQGGEDFLRLTYGAEARIPEDTVCSAQAFIPASSGAAMDEGSSLAEKYEQAAREKAARDYPEWDKIEVRMFDLQLAANGQTVQAEDALHSELTLAQPIRSEALLLLHFEDNEAQEELRRIYAGETAGASSVEVHLPEVMHDAEFIRNANGEVYKIRFASQTLNTFAVVIRGESEETENRKEETAHETEPLTEAGTEAATETLTESTAAGDETEEAAETETGNVYAETEEATEAVTETASEATEEATEDTTESEESVGEGETESELEEQYPEVEFSDSTQYTQVQVYAPEGAFPEGTQMLLSDVEDDETIAAICDAALTENSLVQKVHAVDISFRNSRNEEVEPLLPIRVEMTAEKCAEVGSSSVSSSVVHVDDSGNATIVENAQKVEAEAEDEKDADKLEDVETIAFEAKEFSVYALVYTVDFEYSVNGKMYNFSLRGGENITLSELVEVLGIHNDTNKGEFDSVAGFMEQVKEVAFSDESLVKVTQIDSDWVLESLVPFTSEEELAITMKNGDVVTLKVTDAQGEDGIWDLSDTDNTQFLHVSADTTVTQNEQERDAAFKLNFTYSLTEDVVHAIDAYEGTPVLRYDLNSLITDTPIGDIRNNLNGVISIGSRKLGTYTIVDGVVTLRFTDTSYFDGRSTFTGFFNVTVQTSDTELGSNDEYTYTFPGTTDVIPIHYKKTVEEGKKSYNTTQNSDGSYTIHYTADINVNSDLDSMVFNDTLGGLQSLDASSVKINGTPVTVSQNGQNFSFNVASALGTTGVAKGSYKVTYDTTVTEAQLKAMAADKTTETNTASWRVNGNKNVPGGNTTIEIDKPREPIPVVKEVDKSAAQPGDTVTYTVTYGKETTELSGFHISDYITDVVIPQGDVTLSYNGQTTHVNFDSQATDSSYSKGSVTLFDYTFPEGTSGNGPVTATYTVKLIDADAAKTNGIYDATVVSNTAQEHRQNTQDTERTNVTYEKEPVYTVVKTENSTKREDGKWDPETVISYTLTIGDADTNMAGVNIKDVMTDLQVLQGDVMIKVGNGSQMKLSDYVSGAIKWSDDGKYSTNDVELFNFNMPGNAGNGPVVITYSTKVVSQSQATSNDVFGEKQIKNTGSGGKQSDGTNGTGSFNPYPIEKTVTKSNADVNGQTVEMGDTVHYTLTYGEAGMNLAGAVIEDQMTDLQKLVSAITVTKADGTSFTMPTGTGQWSEDGNNWDFWDDGKYSTGKICLFKYKLPADIGQGPITIEYDTQIISEAEANESGIHGDQSAFNDFRDKHDTVETEVKIEFPKQVTHTPQVRKEFDHWDVENSKVYWNIIVEKDADSAYPLENVTVQECWDRNEVSITEGNQGYYGYNRFDGSYFDITNAVVTTDDGTVLTPGVDYTIDKATTKFTFAKLNERVHINLAFLSPAKIIDGYYMENKVRLNNDKEGVADQTYNKPEVEAVKNGKYNEDSRIVTWEVQINPKAKPFNDSNPPQIIFEDYIPTGLTLVNYNSGDENDPSIHVHYDNSHYDVGQNEPNYGNYIYYASSTLSIDTQSSGQTRISANIAPVMKDWQGNQSPQGGLSGKKIVVTYKTKLSDEEWDRITSSASGAETFENNVTITAGDDEKFDATDKVTVTSDGYITKTDTTKEAGGVVFDETTDQNSKNITYSIEINPHGYALNNGNTLSLTDYIDTNMDLDTASVAISNATLGADGKLHAGDTVPDDIEVSYNDDSRLLSIREIPDRTPLLLTYTCIARAQGQDTFTNTATLVGGGSHSASTHETHTIQTNDAGVKIDGIDMSIRKIDENNISKNLEGAKFQLYECELSIGDLTNAETYPQTWWDGLLAKVDQMTAGTATDDLYDGHHIYQDFKITNYKAIGEPVTTASSGYTQWTALNEHKLYAWVEVEAPEGYTGYASDDYHYFVGYQHINVNTDTLPQPLLSDAEQLNRKHAAWALDDACQFANGIRVASMANLTTWTATNVESKYTSISATKVWENDSDNLFETRPEGGIKLQLVRINADGSRDNIGEKVSINVDDGGNWPTYIWNKLPSQDVSGNTLKYTVVEDKVENYSTTYSDDGAGQTSGEIKVTNRMIPKSTDIHVKKVFDVNEGDELPSEIKVSLMVIKTDRNGVAGEPEETSYETRLSESNEWKWTFNSLPTTDSEGNTLSYTAVEDTAALAAQGFRYIVTYSDNGTGVIETTEDNPLVITNAKETGKITVKKTFAGVEDLDDLAALQSGLTITVTGKDAGGKGVDTRTLTWNDVKDGGYEISRLPINETYTVTENISAESVLPKYTVKEETVSSATVTATAEGETAELKNVYEEAPQTGSLKITKSVTINGSPIASDATEAQKKLADGTYTFEIWNADCTSQVTTKADGTTPIGTLQITVTNGVASPAELTVDGLTAGNYVVKETGSTNIATMIDTTAAGYNSEKGGIVVTVAAGDTSVPTAAFTNNYEETSATVKKVWSDSGSSKRPTSLTVTLVEDGVAAEKAVTLSSSNGWEDTISNLPKYKNGQEIEYTWLEGDMPDGYFLTNVAAEGTVTTLTNTLSTCDLKTSYTGIKSWSDEGNKYSTRPTDLTVTLYADGTATSLTPVWAKDEATNQWTYTFENLPVFSESGSIIKYTAEETVPAGYTQTAKEQTETTGSFGTITYEDGTKRITPDNKINWTLGSLIDLSFVAIKPTANGDVVVWTHRVPVPSEKTAIINLIRNNALPGCSGRNVVFYSGTGSSVYTPHGNIKVDYDQENLSVSIDFGDTSVWSQFIVGQFNQSNSSSYNIGTTAFTNTLETTTLSGSKTWVIDGTTVPENPILTLTRTVTTTTGEGEDAVTTTSTPETVKVKDGETEVNLQPTWSGTGKERTFEYTGLPAKDKDGNTYTYSVAEYQFTVGDVTYTVTKDAYGAYVATPDAEHTETAAHFQVNQTGNAITNTKVTDFEFSKIWKDISSNPVEWPTGATITVTLNAYTNSSTQEAVLEDQTLTFSPTSLPDGWSVVTSADGKKTTFKTNGLPAVAAAGDALTYYVVETQVTGYKEPSYADKDGHGLINAGKATNGQQIINAPEDGVELPSTGGSGTLPYTLGGIALLVFATLMYGFKMRRRERRSN